MRLIYCITTFLLFSLLSGSGAFARENACNIEKRYEHLKRWKFGSLPNIDYFCERIKTATPVEKRKLLFDLARKMHFLDDITAHIGKEQLNKMSEREKVAARMALRSLRDLMFFEKYGKTEEGSYFFGASVMTLGLLRLHTEAVYEKSDFKNTNYNYVQKEKEELQGNIISFDAFAKGNRYIFLDVITRSALFANPKCNLQDIRGLDLSRALNEGIGSDQFPIKTDGPKCQAFMRPKGNISRADHIVEMVNCEQELAGNTIYKFSETNVFATAINNFNTEQTRKAQAPLKVLKNNGSASIYFPSLQEFWEEKAEPDGGPFFGNYNYRTPWLRENVDLLRKIIRKQESYELDALFKQIKEQAFFFLDPKVRESCYTPMNELVLWEKPSEKDILECRELLQPKSGLRAWSEQLLNALE